MKSGYLVRALSILAISAISLPLVALLAKVSWSELFTNLSQENSLRAIWLSIWTSLLAVMIALILGVPLAWLLARSKNRVTNILRPIVLSPIVLPPTVAGIALISLLGRNGLIGRVIYQITGWAAPFTTSAVVITGIFVGLPFVTLISESAFRHLPKDVEDAAIIDRASSSELFNLIAIPQARGAIAVGAILAWARAIGEFGATLMFAGSLPGRTQTWTMLIYEELDVDVPTAYSLAAVMLLIAVSLVFALRKPLREAIR